MMFQINEKTVSVNKKTLRNSLTKQPNWSNTYGPADDFTKARQACGQRLIQCRFAENTLSVTNIQNDLPSVEARSELTQDLQRCRRKRKLATMHTSVISSGWRLIKGRRRLDAKTARRS